VSVRCLVVENDPTSDLGHFEEWLTDGGLDLHVLRAHQGEPLPADLSGYGALIVLGGEQSVRSEGGTNEARSEGGTSEVRTEDAAGVAWFPAVEALLRTAVRERVPTLGICLGAQMLASAHSGTVERSPAGPEIGPRLVAKRDAAESDPLFGPLPMLPDVIQWHGDEITELPLNAVLLATSTNYPVQAFRIGTAAWGVQFHPENDLRTLTSWVDSSGPLLAELGLSGVDILEHAAALEDDLFEVWHPFATRFAAVALGELAPAPDTSGPRRLPLLGQ
jgi:GMP synthase-like glutamine amidotransferase